MNPSRLLIQMLHACGANELPAKLFYPPAREHIAEAIAYLRGQLDEIERVLLGPS